MRVIIVYMKTTYSNRLTSDQEIFLIERLKQKWEEGIKAEKKHERVQNAKKAGLAVGSALLKLTLVAGAITIAAVAPGFFVAMGMMSKGKRYHSYLAAEDFPQKLNRGSSNNYWRYEKIDENTWRMVPTKKGRQMAFQAELKKFKLFTEEKWDGKWRVVIFDIKKKHNSARDAFRNKLTEMGMQQLQKSVFVYPYECKKEIEMWQALIFVSADVKIMESSFEPALDKELRKIFKLKRPTLF